MSSETKEPNLSSHQLINQSSGDVEIYTPTEIVERWREVLGVIDLDPASSERANERIKAKTFYTEPSYDLIGNYYGTGLPKDLPIRKYRGWGGLDMDWKGNVAMNPPFSLPDKACLEDCNQGRCIKRGWHTATDLPGTPHWINKMESEYNKFHVKEGCIITFASTLEKWFRPLLRRPQCFLSPRTNYVLPDGTIYKGVTKGSVVTYYGTNIDKFASVFQDLGEIKIPYLTK